MQRELIRVGRFVAMLTHLSVGWRYWAFASGSHPNALPDRVDCDSFWGLDPNGYATEEEARIAMRRADAEADARLTSAEVAQR